MHDFDKLLNAWLMEGLFESEESKKEKFISVSSLNRIPAITIPSLSEKSNRDLRFIAKEVLLLSRNNNNCNDVAITYDIQSLDIKDDGSYVITKGDETSVKFMNDENVKDLIDKSSGISIVNLHNHPRMGGFSIQDISIFCFIEKIRLMAILKNSGEMAIMFKGKDMELRPLIIGAIKKCVPDLASRKKEAEDIISALREDEKRTIVKETVKNAGDYGIICTDWIDWQHAGRASEQIADTYNMIVGKQQEKEDDGEYGVSFDDVLAVVTESGSDVQDTPDVQGRNEPEGLTTPDE